MNARLVVVALLLVSVAFQTSGQMTLAAADSLISHATFRGFFPAENGLRWSGARSAVVFPDPGPGAPVRIELLLSGWRPPGTEGPRVTVAAGGRSVTSRPGAGAEVVSLDVVTSGWWRSDLVVELQSDTFEPGAGDARKLGVRVEEARLVPTSRGLRRPPLGAPLGSAIGALLIAFVLGRAGVAPKAAERVSLCAVVMVAALYAVARPWAAVWSGPVLLATFLIAIMVRLMPRATRGFTEIVAASTRAFLAGLGRLRDAHVATLVVMGVLLVTLAYRAEPRIEIDLGSGREVAVAQGFGSFEGNGGLKSRRAPRGAQLDLSDFGGGASWKVGVSAAQDGAPRDVAVLRAGAHELVISLQEAEWTEGAMSVPAPFGWKSGLLLAIPGGSDALRVDRVTIERGSALPSLRIVTAVIATALLAMIAFGSAGLSARVGKTASALLLFASATALAEDPLAAIPFAFSFLAIVAVAALLAAVVKGMVTVLDNGERLLPSPVAIGAAVSGWVAWLSATAFPYYRGGHFVFHSSIAEEIWKGRFLIYYLPFPGSMLSEQAQWGRIVMPHPAMYQTLVSPLAALPRPWFYLSEKVFLATLFASLVLVASIVAARVSGPRAAAFTAVLFAGLVPGFQLLGLGHLMTILGVWSSSLAIPWLLFKVDDLGRFRTWSATVALFTFCFLSYTAALLFTGAVLVLLIAASAGTNMPRARSLFTMLVAACAFAFVLYYIHWALPFLSQSVPKIMGGVGLGDAGSEATPILSRLSLEPGKLSYSYGSMLIPLLGALGLLFLPRSWDRRVLISWAGILFLVSGADLFFNFLLKHHYYVMVPVAVGLGGLVARIEARWGRIAAMGVTLLVVSLGLKTALDVALGRIP